MITKADRTDINQLKKIWKTCFEDEDELIDQFLGACNLRDTLVGISEGVIAASLYMVPMNSGRAVYFYALATLPEYRRRGIMTSLIKKALDICEKSGATYAFLIPAEEFLVDYYNNLGFSEKAVLTDRGNMCLEPDSEAIKEFVMDEEKKYKAGTPEELYGAGNALVCCFDGEAPSCIGGYIPF